MNTNKILKISKIPLYVFLGCLIIVLLCIFGISKFSEPKKIDKIYDYNELISSDKDEEGMYAEMDFVSMPFEFAVYEGEYSKEHYYMVYDSNGYLYIVNLNEYLADMLIEQYEENPDDFTYHVEGYIFNVDDDCKKLAIDFYNDGEEIVTEENYKDFFGKTYISTIKEPTNNMVVILGVILSFSVIIGLVFLIIFLIYFISAKKTFKKYNVNELEGELQKSTTKCYEKLELYLTDRYLISKANGLRVSDYKNINKVCINRMPYNGVQLIIFLNNGKKYIAMESFKRTKQMDTINEIIELLKIKNSNIEVKDSVAVTLTYNKEL